MGKNHSTLSKERWSNFTVDQQILMIGNEMNRARQFFESKDLKLLSDCYERVLNLTDLTVAVQDRISLRRELKRWRGLIAELFIAQKSDSVAHDESFRCLLQFTPETALQIPFLFPKEAGRSD